jgi:hypothetical protein
MRKPAAGTPVAVTSVALFEDYRANEVGADEKYKDKPLLVSGAVDRIRTDVFGGVIVLMATSNRLMPVRAHIEDSDKSEASELRKNDQISVMCKGGGVTLGNPVLRNCTFSGGGPVTTETRHPAEARPSGSPAAERDDQESQLPWLGAAKSNCASYMLAANEIKKSAIFTENTALLSAATVQKVRGKLTRISTNRGGTELRLQVIVGRVEFNTESLFGPVKKGTDVYAAASDLAEGQCVIFSGNRIKASSISERAQVCDTEYFINFTSLEPCQ